MNSAEKFRAFVVDDEASVCEAVKAILETEGIDSVSTTDSVAAVEEIKRNNYDLIISDLKMPKLDGLELYDRVKDAAPDSIFMIITAFGTIPSAVDAIKKGIYDYIPKPFTPDEVRIPVRRALERRKLERENVALRTQIETRYSFQNIIGTSAEIREVFRVMRHAASSESSVLVTGESGTGKELVARAIHSNSVRTRRRFVTVNCGAIPDGLIESELFGHVKGAFTGASTDKSGLLEEAHRGSLLLDEITEMPLDLQAKLLRVLEDRTVRRLGGAKTVPVDFRLICSTNREPEVALREGRLRQELYFRINTVTVALPSLRDRTGDIPLLAKSFLERFRAKHGRDVETIDPEAYRRLLSYGWPGNIRELEHAIERAVLVARGREITLADLPEPLQVDPLPGGSAPPPGSLEEIERVSIVRALESTGWNKQAAAQVLGLRRPTLYSKMRRHGIPQRRA